MTQRECNDFIEGGWVANFSIPERPSFAKVKEVYEYGDELLLDLVLYQRDGTRIGRESPPCGGHKGFEPACSAQYWEPIEEPDFGELAGQRYHWGHLVSRLRAAA